MNIMKIEFYTLGSCSKRWTHMNLMSFNLSKIKACSFNSLIVTKGKNSLRKLASESFQDFDGTLDGIILTPVLDIKTL